MLLHFDDAANLTGARLHRRTGLGLLYGIHQTLEFTCVYGQEHLPLDIQSKDMRRWELLILKTLANPSEVLASMEYNENIAIGNVISFDFSTATQAMYKYVAGSLTAPGVLQLVGRLAEGFPVECCIQIPLLLRTTAAQVQPSNITDAALKELQEASERIFELVPDPYPSDAGKLLVAKEGGGSYELVDAGAGGAVPVTRQINGHELTQDIWLDASDVSAVPSDAVGVTVASLVDGQVPLEQLPPLDYVPLTRTINGLQLDSDIVLDASDVDAIPYAEKGQPGGVPSLDNTGKVPLAQLPNTATNDIDESTITKNADQKLQAVALKETNAQMTQHVWIGTLVEYNEQHKADSSDICFITDDASDPRLVLDVDSEMDASSINPVQNQVITRALQDKADLVGGKVPASQLPESSTATWGDIEGNIADQSDLQQELSAKQDVIDAEHKLPYSLVSDTPDIPAAQVQADWDESDSSEPDYIKNKPSLNYIPTTAKGAANGVAPLDSASKVPAANLPAMEYLPLTGGELTGSVNVTTGGYTQSVTEISAATTGYPLASGGSYRHTPTAAPTYTLPEVTDATRTRDISLTVTFSAEALSIAFEDEQGNIIAPLMEMDIKAGATFAFVCEYVAAQSAWAVMPIDLGGAQ